MFGIDRKLRTVDIKHFDNVNSAQEFRASMPQPPGTSSRYGGPNNIVIVPTVSIKNNSAIPSANLQKIGPITRKTAEQNVSAKTILGQPKAIPLIEHQQKLQSSSIDQIKPTPSMDQLESKLTAEHLKPLEYELIQKTPETLSKEDVNKNFANVEDLNKTKKVNSWASNYLQSIGHNNIKPIKITLCSSRNKTQKAETVSKNNESYIVAQPTLLKNMDNPLVFGKANEKIIDEHINVDNIKTVHPANVCTSNTNETSDVHVIMAPVPSSCDNITAVNSTVMLDTIYSSNSSKALTHTTLLSEGNSEAIYCYNDRNREIDILDAIKSKINCEYVIEQKSRATNLHKDMCEEFIKEISNNKPSLDLHSQKKSNRSNTSSPAKKKLVSKIKIKNTTAKFESKTKKLVKKDKNIFIKESSKTTKTERSKKSKHASLEVDKPDKKKKKVAFKKSNFKKQHVKKPCFDLKDLEKKGDHDNLHFKNQQIKKCHNEMKGFDSLGKHMLDKETEKELKTQIHSPERQKLKRVHSNSDDLHNSSSEIPTHSPIRSVVFVAENCQSNSPKRQCLEESFDLRSKLSRVNQRIYKKQIESDLNKKANQRDNLKITVENINDEKQKSPKKSGVLKYKTKKCKKLKLIINVVCQGSEDETTSSDSSCSEAENNPTHNMDLSFLDDINVDEIVDSLKYSPKPKMRSPLPHDCKMEDNTKMTAEPDVKLATIFNILHVKTEANKFNTSEKTCKIDETVKTISSTRTNMNNLRFSPNITDVKKYRLNKEENTNTTHGLVKTLSQTKLQLQQQTTASSDDDNLKAQCVLAKEYDSNINQEEGKRGKGNERSLTDESVIINEQEITIIDLTDEHVCAASETSNIAISAIPKSENKRCENENVDLKSEEIMSIDYHSRNSQIDVNENNSKTEKQMNLMQSTHPKEISNSTTIANKMDVETNMAILHKCTIDEIIIDLTNDTIEDKIKSDLPTIKTASYFNAKHNINTKNTNYNNKKSMIKTEAIKEHNNITQIDIVKKILINQDIHMIPIADIRSPKEILVDNETQIVSDEKGTRINSGNQTENEKLEKNVKLTKHSNAKESAMKYNTNEETYTTITAETETRITTDEKEIHKITDTRTENEIQKQNVQSTNDNSNTKKIQIKDNNNKELSPKKPVKTAFTSDTISVRKESNLIIEVNEEKRKETDRYVHEMKETTTKGFTSKDNKNMSKVFESKAAIKVVKKIVENVWDTKNESKANNDTTTEIQPESASKVSNDAKNEPENKSIPITNEKIFKNGSIIAEQQKALTVLLEDRMQNYLHKEIKIIKHIRLGKYSNIFSCKDASGQTYAAKVLKNQNNRQGLGIQKEKMIRQLQQDIPKENLNTIYLIDGFGVQRYWCFLTEYYPTNLEQVLNQKKMPFHINQVQNLARQLISAVMVLRNNEVVHSDIKPSHILLNSTNDKLKLCGFDGAYYINNVYPLPNIGTMSYRAPEIIIGFSAGYSIDVWSSALVIHQMATNQKLFPGMYNNDILYKQMCTFGNLPRDMVELSPYRNQHFQGRSFIRRVGFKGKYTELYQKFYKSKRLRTSLIAAYNNNWQSKGAYQRDTDLFKLAALNRLLEQMLLLDPRVRLAIEFVCADPFIYEMFL